MPTFDDSIATEAPVEEVWKLLYDPARFPEWWVGVATTEPRPGGGYTMYPDGFPDFPMPQQLRADADGQRVTISCLVSDLVFAWRLEPLDGDRGTSISVHAEIPEREADRLEGQRAAISASLRALAALAIHASVAGYVTDQE
jgi:uncharacterized protein YndB with AHSA1/START domain